MVKCRQSYLVCRFLEPQYRRPLILQELLGFHADIICLQEVDEKAFAEYFLPQLQQAGTVGSSWPICMCWGGGGEGVQGWSTQGVAGLNT